jgi:hypothetical protein
MLSVSQTGISEGIMNRIAQILVMVGVVFAGGVAAQGRPDLSGTWRSADSTLTIRQDDKTIVITAVGGETAIYNLDGTDRRVEDRTDRGTSQVTTQAKWVGSALLITSTTVSSIGTWQDLEVYSLDYGPKLTKVLVGSQTTRGMMYTTTSTYVRATPPTPNR